MLPAWVLTRGVVSFISSSCIKNIAILLGGFPVAAGKNNVTYAIVLESDPKDYLRIHRFEVGRLLSVCGDVAEMSLHRQRCFLHRSQLYCLNGEERQLANTFPRIDKAREEFTNALKCEPPECYLKRCIKILSGLGLDLAGQCEGASKEIDKCCTIVNECLTEIEISGQIHYENVAKYFYDHIAEVERKLAQNIIKNIKMRS